jgi:hypothetical protein
MSGELAQATKSWTSRPEGKVGTVFGFLLLGGAAIAVLYFWGLILPWLIMMAANTLTLIGLCAAIAGILFIVFDPRWRNLAWYGYKSFMRGLTGMFIELDPIGILKSYVTSLKDKLEEMDKSLANLDGQRGKLRKQIADNEKARVHALKMMEVARDQKQNAAMTLQGRQAERLAQSNVSLQDLLTRMDRLATVLGKMREASAIMIEDITNEVELKSRERAALLAGYNAFSKARSVMKGGGDEAEIFNMTMEKLTDDYGMKMGEIDNFMKVSQGFLETVDLENGVAQKSAIEQLEAWENKSANILGPTNGTDVHLRVGDAAPALPASSDDFADLFTSDPATLSASVKR